MGLAQLQTCASVFDLENRVPAGLQNESYQLANRIFVLRQENALGALWRGGESYGLAHALHDRLGHRRQEDPETRAVSHLGLAPDGAAALLHNAQDSGQTEPGSLAGFLGGEERLEDLL